MGLQCIRHRELWPDKHHMAVRRGSRQPSTMQELQTPQIAGHKPDMLFQWPPKWSVPCRDWCVVSGPDVQFVIILQQQGPFARVKLGSGALRLNDELARVLFLLFFFLLRHWKLFLHLTFYQQALYASSLAAFPHADSETLLSE